MSSAPGPRPTPRRVGSFGRRALHRLLSTLYIISPDGTVEVTCDREYLLQVLSVIAADESRSRQLRDAAAAVRAAERDRERNARSARSDVDNRAYLRLRDVVNEESNGDHREPTREPSGVEVDDRTVSVPSVRVPLVLFLDQLRSPFNAGNIIRSAAAFGIAGVVLGERSPSLDHPRLVRAAMGASKIVPCTHGTLDDALYLLKNAASPGEANPIVYALETGGQDIRENRVTVPAVVVLGHEQYGVSDTILEAARRSGGVVTIPHVGGKRSLNVGVAAGILLFLATTNVGRDR